MTLGFTNNKRPRPTFDLRISPRLKVHEFLANLTTVAIFKVELSAT